MRRQTIHLLYQLNFKFQFSSSLRWSWRGLYRLRLGCWNLKEEDCVPHLCPWSVGILWSSGRRLWNSTGSISCGVNTDFLNVFLSPLHCAPAISPYLKIPPWANISECSHRLLLLSDDLWNLCTTLYIHKDIDLAGSFTFTHTMLCWIRLYEV